MLKLMWQKWDKRGMVGGKKILSFFLGLQAFCTLGDTKKGRILKASRDFQLLVTNAEEKKKSSANVFSRDGASYPYPGNPHKGPRGWFYTYKSIKNTPQGTEKRVIRRQTVVHKYKGDSWTFPHRDSIMRQVRSQ